jgi:hypothetical protein
MNVGEQAKTREKRKYIIRHLRRGKLPKQVIELVMEEYGIQKDQAAALVYNCNKEIKDSLQDLYDDAADYLTNNLQALAEQAIEAGDRKSALKAYEQLAKICKVGVDDNKVDLNIHFDFDK